ncbi:hypothetical protein [Brevibacillus sp. 179-C9.3 HS]|uniref:hypothetical protein n=1 Tax=unclassified Brevibacillus TaxID=2684853 RepID=UPI0039A378B9
MEAIILTPLIVGMIILYILTPFLKSKISGILWLVIGGLCTLLLLSIEGVKIAVMPFPVIMIVIGSLLCLKNRKAAYVSWLSIFIWFSILYTILLGIPGALMLIVGLTWSIYMRKRFDTHFA